MGVLLFLLLHAAHVFDTHFDGPWVCLLVALEAPQWARIIVHLREQERRGG